MSSESSSTQAHDTAEARTAFVESFKSVGANLDTDLRARATTLHENETIINKQQEELKKTTQNVAKESKELEKLVDQGQKGLKEVGDLQNFAEMMERDLLVVEETLRLAEEDDRKEGRFDKPVSGLRRWF